MTKEIASTWATRDLPILASALQLLDSGAQFAGFEDICAETGLDLDTLHVGVRALETAQPPYIHARFLGSKSGHVDSVHERARRELGSWPDANDLLDQLVSALATAAEHEPEPERKTRLGAAANVLGGMAREIAVAVISARLGRIE